MRRLLPIFCLLPLAGALWAWAIVRRPAAPPTAPADIYRPPYDPSLLQKTIVFYEERVRRDPIDAMDRAKLADLFLQRCRETADIADALRAEKIARCALAIRTSNHGDALDALAQSLTTQHRFAEAKTVADAAATVYPDDPQARRLRVEIRLELGDYDDAAAALRAGGPTAENASLKTLRARMLALDGHADLALALLRQAQVDADGNVDMPRENVAWYHLRVGDLLYTVGRAAEAARAYREALDLFPRDYKALFGLARLAAGSGRWREAVEWGQKAEDIVPTPETVALVGDACAAQGNREAAGRQYRLVEAIGKLSRAQGTVYDRQRALFCADHGLHLDEALALARRELRARHDIYAYDTLAWVCCKKGLLAEADRAMRRALARGTQDALLTYHAGRIARARGDRAQADDYLVRAHALNPTLWHGSP